MLEINLLPKEYQKRRFNLKLEKNTLMVLGGGVLILVLLFAYSMFFQIWPINSLDGKIVELQEEAKKFDSEIALIKKLTDEKNVLLNRMKTIDILDKDREAWISVLSDIGSRIPNYLWLTNFEQGAITDPAASGGPLPFTIEGKTFSINALASLLISLKKSEYVDDLEITNIELKEERNYEAYNFTLTCRMNIGTGGGVQGNNTLIADKQTAGSEF